MTNQRRISKVSAFLIGGMFFLFQSFLIAVEAVEGDLAIPSQNSSASRALLLTRLSGEQQNQIKTTIDQHLAPLDRQKGYHIANLMFSYEDDNIIFSDCENEISSSEESNNSSGISSLPFKGSFDLFSSFIQYPRHWNAPPSKYPHLVASYYYVYDSLLNSGVDKESALWNISQRVGMFSHKPLSCLKDVCRTIIEIYQSDCYERDFKNNNGTNWQAVALKLIPLSIKKRETLLHIIRCLPKEFDFELVDAIRVLTPFVKKIKQEEDFPYDTFAELAEFACTDSKDCEEQLQALKVIFNGIHEHKTHKQIETLIVLLEGGAARA